jgi:hypothetical protein
MLRAFPRCDECGRLILGHEDGGPGARAALITSAQQTSSRVQFAHRPGYFHAGCLESRVAFHRRRARWLLTIVSGAACLIAAAMWWFGGPPVVALLPVALGSYAAYLEATDVRALTPTPAQ